MVTISNRSSSNSTKTAAYIRVNVHRKRKRGGWERGGYRKRRGGGLEERGERRVWEKRGRGVRGERR